MPVDLCFEHSQRAVDQFDHAIGVAAGAAPGHHGQPSTELRFGPAPPVAGNQDVEGSGDGGQPVDAWAALTGRLPGHPVDD
jgi:hypothetical protein